MKPPQLTEKLCFAMSFMSSQVDDFIQREGAEIRLRMFIGAKDKYCEALELLKTSDWTISQLTEYARMTGCIPPESAKKYPYETMRLSELMANK